MPGPFGLPGLRAVAADAARYLGRHHRERAPIATEGEARLMTRAFADPPRQARVEGPQLPTRDDLDRATAVTAATIADPGSGPADIYRAAEVEAAVLSA